MALLNPKVLPSFLVYQLYFQLHCSRPCIVSNAGSLSIYYCDKGPDTALGEYEYGMKTKPPNHFPKMIVSHSGLSLSHGSSADSFLHEHFVDEIVSPVDRTLEYTC